MRNRLLERRAREQSAEITAQLTQEHMEHMRNSNIKARKMAMETIKNMEEQGLETDDEEIKTAITSAYEKLIEGNLIAVKAFIGTHRDNFPMLKTFLNGKTVSLPLLTAFETMNVSMMQLLYEAGAIPNSNLLKILWKDDKNEQVGHRPKMRRIYLLTLSNLPEVTLPIFIGEKIKWKKDQVIKAVQGGAILGAKNKELQKYISKLLETNMKAFQINLVKLFNEERLDTKALATLRLQLNDPAIFDVAAPTLHKVLDELKSTGKATIEILEEEQPIQIPITKENFIKIAKAKVLESLVRNFQRVRVPAYSSTLQPSHSAILDATENNSANVLNEFNSIRNIIIRILEAHLQIEDLITDEDLINIAEKIRLNHLASTHQLQPDASVNVEIPEAAVPAPAAPAPAATPITSPTR
jgi:hypothetical protein